MKLLFNMKAVWAEETLRERGGELTAKSVRSLTLAATGDPHAADLAYAKRVIAIEEERRPSG